MMLDLPEEKPDGAVLRAADYATLTSRAVTDHARALVEKVHELIIATEARKRKRGNKAADFKRAVAGFLGDLLQAAARTTVVYRSASPKNFTASDAVSHRDFTAMRSALRSLRLIEEFKAVQDRFEFGPGQVAWRGRAIRFKATSKLIELAASCGVSLAEACEHFVQELPRKPLVLRGHSRREPGRKKMPGKLMKIDRTQLDVQTLEQAIIDINMFLQKFLIRGGTHRGYIRVFNVGNHPSFAWNMGGRLYSQGQDSNQSLSSDKRLQMSINDEPVCELDIRASYLTIFHAQRGQPLDQSSDPYGLLGPGEEARNVVKGFVAATFGSSAFPGRWSTALTRDFLEQTGRKLGRVYPLHMVREAVARAYPFLAGLKSDEVWPPLWAELMFIESDAILKTMVALKERGIPSLSVHDSLIVPEREETTARELLSSFYEATTTTKPVIRSRRAGDLQAR
jgi:hypothetical protein